MEIDNILWVVLGIVVAVAVTIVLLNLAQGEKKIEHEIGHEYGPATDQFLRSMGNLLPPPILPGNRVETLRNGDEIFPAMLRAIHAAERTVCFETFIYWSGRIGADFAHALAQRAQRGVRVHVLLDWIGSKSMEQRYLREMEKAGVMVERYHKPSWRTVNRMNNRTHRKLLICDGVVGFIGGVGIADEWLGHAQDEHHWRDTHFRLTGPAVAQMQAAFMDNWLKTHSSVLHGEAYFPALEPDGSCRAQVFQSSPQEGSESVRLMYLLSIACAEKRILIENSYFVPDDLAVRTLVDARRRGVDVQIIVPGGHIDAKVVRRASRARWGPLLEAGVAIYEFQPTMFHCKVMVIDDLWVSVGSTNFDNRSFRLNDEANLNIHDPDFGREQAAIFEQDKARSRQITYDEWLRRPLQEKAVEHAAALLRGQL